MTTLPDSVHTPTEKSLEQFTAVLERSEWVLYHFLRGIVGDDEQARDLVQDVCYEACRAAQRGTPPFACEGSSDTDLRRWLFRVGYNRAISVLRRRRIIRWLPLEEVRLLISFEEETVEGQDVRSALARLAPADAACLTLIIVHHFTAAEVGQIIGASPQAVGGTYAAVYNHTSDPGTLYETPLLWHYLNGAWSAVQLPIHGQLRSISMDSPTDGWAIGQNDYDQAQDQIILLHYDGHTWKQIPAVGMTNAILGQVQMLSATNGWIIGTTFASGPTQTIQDSGIWHYDGHTWTEQSLPVNLTKLVQQDGLFQVSGISMISDTEGWAAATLVPSSGLASTPSATPSPSDISPSGVILHYTDGRWEVQQMLPKAYLHAVSMLSSTNGWLSGQTDTRTITADPNSPGGVTHDKTAPLLLHYVQGQWKNVTSSVNVNPGSIEVFLALFMRSATDGWAVFLPASLSHNTPTLFHYNGSQWNRAPLPTIQNTSIYYLTGVFMTSATEGWAVGNREVKSSPGYTLLNVPVIYHLHNGVWSVAKS